MPKHLFCYLHNVSGMIFIKRKNQCLGQIIQVRLTLWVGKHLRIYRITVSFQYQFYLCRIDNTPVKFFACIVFCLFIIYRFNFSGIARCSFYFLSFENCAPIFCYLCFDTINTTINVYTIND